MRYFLLIFFIILIYSCNENKDKTDVQKDSALIRNHFINTQKKDNANYKDSIFNEKLLGIWGNVGEHKAAFMIEEDKIYYLEQSKYYPYKIENDTIKIKYDNYEGAFAIRFYKGDTLTLTGDKEQKYRRFEN